MVRLFDNCGLAFIGKWVRQLFAIMSEVSLPRAKEIKVNIGRAAIVLLAILASPSGRAVSLSQDGRGQVLLYPYYTTHGTNDTLFSIVNSTAAGKAVKVRFREGRYGHPALDFNVYLGPHMTWTGGVSRDPSNNPVLRTWDQGCTVPQFVASPTFAGATEIALSNAAYANADRAGSGLDRAKEGFFEVVEMGEVSPSFEVSPGKNFLAAIVPVAGDCAAVNAAWQSGGAFRTSAGAELTVPTGGLLGMGALINVLQGTDYSFDPTVLTHVFLASTHTAPGDSSPNLANATPASTVIADDSVVQSTWEHGIDAVSAVLMHHSIINEYVSSIPALEAATDLVLTFPTKSYYVVKESDTGQVTRSPFAAKFDDLAPLGAGASGAPLADGTSTGACESGTEFRYARTGLRNYPAPSIGGVPPGGASPFSGACWAASVLPLMNVLDSTNIIKDPPISETSHYTTYGQIQIGFPPSQTESRSLTSKEGITYLGLPVIGFAVQKYISGNLNGVLSNYGGTLSHKYITVVQ